MGKRQERVVCDTNVLISGLGWRGPERSLLETCPHGDTILLLSHALIDEFVRVAAYPKFGFTPEQVSEFVELLLESAEITSPRRPVNAVADEADNRVLECALAGHATAVITGDKHLLDLGHFSQIPIMRAADWIKDASRQLDRS